MLERLLDERGDIQEADSTLEERGDGDLVRGVERARIGAATPARLAREREQAERLEVGLEELQRSRPSGRVSAAASQLGAGYVSAYEIGTRMSG